MAGVRKGLESWAVIACLSVAIFIVAVLIACSTAMASPPRYELVKKFGPDGSAVSGFERAGAVAVDQQSHFVYAIDRLAGKIYKFDGDGSPVNWGGSAAYISGNELSGLSFAGGAESQLAVDSTSHTIYVTSGGSIVAFAANGEASEFAAGPGAGSNIIPGFSGLAGLAVDANGYIYASDNGAQVVKIFTPTGEEVTSFADESPANLAVDTTGAVYVTRLFGPVRKATPSSYPVTPTTTYGLASFNEKDSYAVGIDPATDNVYIVQLNSDPKVAVYDQAGAPITTFGEPGTEGELFVGNGIAIDADSAVPGEGLRVYVGNVPPEGEGLSQVNIFRPEPPKPPAVEYLTVANISNTAVSLHALINPNQVSTSYHFEYGLEDCSVSVCVAVPLEGEAIGAGNDGVAVAQAIKGLQPNTEYHYRIVAENELGTAGESAVFRTQAADLAFALSDSRVWEMVSPVNKRGALLVGAENGQIQAAADGNGIAYLSVGSIETDPQGSRAVENSSVLARRGGAGWQSEDIAAANSVVSPAAPGQGGEYKLFSTDLSKGVLDPRSQTLLSPEASERAPYLRENSKPPLYTPLVTGKEGFANVPPGTEFGGKKRLVSDVTIREATPDLSHVILYSNTPLIEGAPTGTLYEWVNGQLKPIAVLPADEGGSIVAPILVDFERASVRHAVSLDGSRVYLTLGSLEDPHLYMRDTEAEQTVRIDVVQSGPGAGINRPVFQGASADGTVVFFTDTQHLTENASETGADLYRCEVVSLASGCTNLENLTAVSSENAEVLGMASALSDDGSRIYFVAKGALTSEANQLGRLPAAGQPNLYLWQENEGLAYIATLSPEDSPDWGLASGTQLPGLVSRLSTGVSPSGRYFAFMSERDLTNPGNPSAENVDVTTGKTVERAYRYDAEENRLDCVSCAPTGSAPRGALVENDPLIDPRRIWNGRYVAASLPQPTSINLGATTYQPRAVLENGRMFFNAVDSLVPADSNNQWDVYQFEDLGTGGCSIGSGNAGIVRSGEGCVSLVSSGTDEEESGFLDASITGDDLFFLTSAKLSAADTDNDPDVYDARVGGVAVPPSLVQECASQESCHPGTSQAQSASPSSSSFVGSGNLKPSRKCPKGKHKVKRGGKQRCVPHKGKKKQTRGGGRKGAGR